jgi:hypothetical protein
MKATDETNKNKSGSFERIFCDCVKATNGSPEAAGEFWLVI